MNESDREIYGVVKSNVTPGTDYMSYINALRFWKAVEDKYQSRRQQWIEANSRMVAAKLAAVRAKKELQDSQRLGYDGYYVGSELEETHRSEDEFEEAQGEEFSDVDADMFIDPGARYYSSLDSDNWEQIRTDLMNIHKTEDTDPYTGMQRRRFIRRILIATWIALCCVFAGLYIMFKDSIPGVESEPVQATTSCRLNCDQATVFDSVFNLLFAPNNEKV